MEKTKADGLAGKFSCHFWTGFLQDNGKQGCIEQRFDEAYIWAFYNTSSGCFWQRDIRKFDPHKYGAALR